MTTAPIVTPSTDPVAPPVVTPPVAPVVPVTEPDPKGQTPEQLLADVEKWKAMARKHEDASKAKDDRLKTLDAIEDANKTEAQKLTDRALAAEKTLAEVTARALRAEVAAAKGVPANLITGTTKEEMESAADALVAFKGKPVIPDTGGGARGDDINGAGAQLTQADVDKLTAEKKYDEIVTAQAAGRLNTLLGIKS